MTSDTPDDLPDPDEQFDNREDRPPADPDLPAVPWKLIVLPVLLFICVNLWTPALFYWDQIRYRPWITLPLFVLLNIMVTLSVLGYGLAVSRRYGFRPFFKAVTLKQYGVEFLKSLGLVVVINICISIPILLLMSLVDAQPEEHTYIQIMHQVPGSRLVILGLILMFTVIPLVEEIFFRGFLYNALKTRFVVPAACAVQALLFALCHPYGMIGQLGIFLFAVALALVYDRTGTLLRPVFIHSFRNALVIIPFVMLVAGNLHTPAASYAQGNVPPRWLQSTPPVYVDRQSSAAEQLEYAQKTWGSRGSRQWKKEINALRAVEVWFPDNREVVSEALLAMTLLYYQHLGDYWRAVVTAEKILAQYPDQADECAGAMQYQGWAYYMLKRFDRSRELFTRLIDQYPDQADAAASAEKGLVWLDTVSPGRQSP